MAKGDTKARIVDVALALFNERGSAAVSTNQIAQSAGISPGNLYYHFRNKEEIIRLIFARMNAEMSQIWQVEPDAPSDAQTSTLSFFEAMHRVQLMLLDYRFFQRELSSLLRRDEMLALLYRKVRRQRIEDIETFVERLVESGAMHRPEPPKALSRLIRAAWIVGDYWLDYLDVEGAPIDEESVREGVELIVEIFRPYLVTSEVTQKQGV